uniref:G-protein coupled receptors family 1 profile domain-containing protein n=2 Tax=Lutzomyia longipalpis TaxID=7200 RepID=A0A1B0CF63_LUTLO
MYGNTNCGKRVPNSFGGGIQEYGLCGWKSRGGVLNTGIKCMDNFLLLMIISVFFILPLMVLIILYSIIAKNLISNDISMLRLRPTKSELSHKARKKVVMIIATVVIAHFSCLLPFRILTLWIVIAPDEHVKGVSAERYYNVLFFSRIMLYLNSAINPILYNLMSSKFRKGFTRLCCWYCQCTSAKMWCTRQKQQTPLNTTTTSSFLTHSVNSRKSSSCYRTTLSMDDVRIRNGGPNACRWGNEGTNDNATNDDVYHEKRVTRQSSTPFLGGGDTAELREAIVIKTSTKHHQSTMTKSNEDDTKGFCTQRYEILYLNNTTFIPSSPILSIATYTNETNVDGSEFAVCITAADKLWPASFFVGSIVLFFVIPFLILVVLYSVIARHLMNNPGLISYGHRHVLKYRKQVILMLSAVIFSFFVCLSPFRALTLWIIVVPPEAIMSLGFEAYYNLLYFCRIMLYLNSAINPVLYNLMSSKFRQGFFSLLRCHRLVGSKLLTGTRKGTFHTTSTNLSTSNSGDKHRRQQTEKESAAGGASGVAVGAKVAALANFDGKTQSNYGQTEIDVDLFRSAGPPPNAVTTNTTTNSQAKQQPQPRVESLGGGQVDSTSNLLSIHHHESRVKFKDGPQNKDSSHDVVEREKETLIPQCNGIDDAHLQFDFEALPRLKKESFV